MLMRVALLVLGLGLFFACDDEGDDKPADNTKPALAFIFDDGVADDGKGKIEVQFSRGNKAVTDVAGTEVTLTIACGSNSAEFKGKLDKRGWAEVEVDVSDKKDDWDVTDWGECKVSATTTVDGEEIEAKEVELKTVGQEQGTCEKEGGCDDDGLDTYEIGEEIGIQASLGGGQLSLHDCTAATLYTVNSTNAVSVAANNSVTADTTTKSFPTMFVLGEVGDKCMLQHTPAGGKAVDHAKIEPASIPENVKAAELDITLTNNSDQLKVTLGDKPSEYDYLSDTVRVHISKNSGANWGGKQAKAAWGSTGFDTDVAWEDSNKYGYQALLRVSLGGASSDTDADTASNSNKAAYWSLHKVADIALKNPAAGITVGQVFEIAVLPSQDQERSISSVKVEEACGLHFFGIEKDTVDNKQVDAPAQRIDSTNAIAVGIPASETSFKVLAVNKQGTVYTAGCKIKFNIGGAIVETWAKDDTERPQIDAISVKSKDNSPSPNDIIVVDLPAWNSAHGTKGDNYLWVTKVGGRGDNPNERWSDLIVSPGWGEGFQPGIDWNSQTTTDNQALVSVVVGTGSSAKNWWYYAEAQ